MRLGLAVAGYRGNSDVDLKRFEDAADMFCDMSTLQGLAHLVLEQRAEYSDGFFSGWPRLEVKCANHLCKIHGMSVDYFSVFRCPLIGSGREWNDFETKVGTWK